MKLENFDQAAGIVAKIKDLNSQLKQLNEQFVTVCINENENRFCIFKIRTDQSSKDEHKANALIMVQSIKTEIENKIISLKEELETL